MHRSLTATLVALGVFLVWLYALGLRLPYMDQIPVFDADVTTAAAHMWARIWSDEGPLKIWFATPRSPRSIETPTLAIRTLYESWPPGAFVPIYVAAKFLGVEPTVPLVNWINTITHGLIALAAAFAVFNLALFNRLGSVSSAVLAVGVALPLLLSRGPIYVFSQVYDVVTAVLIYTAIFILLEVLYYATRTANEQRIIGAIQLITIFLAFFVDWLAYNLFAFWIVSRAVAGYLGIEKRLSFRRLIGLALMPISAFSIYMVWRIFAPGSLASTEGLASSMRQLGLKILQRMNLTDKSPVSGFSDVFFGEMHNDYYTTNAFMLIALSALATLVLTAIAFHRSRDAYERRSIFATGSVLVLITIPFYLHMLILYEHTFIHRWAVTKAMFAYSLTPFALLPISIFTLTRQLVGQPSTEYESRGFTVISLVLALSGLYCAVGVVRHQNPNLFGRVDRETYLMWDDIRRNTRYEDVVVSPVLEANPISVQVGVSYKLVHHADSFSDVDKLVENVCGNFNVVLALPKGAKLGPFASREPSEVVDTGRIQLLRFSSYQGRAIGCS
jgi:hypothetical protein